MTSGSLRVNPSRMADAGDLRLRAAPAVVVVAGAPRSGKSAVVDALLGPSATAPRGGSHSVAPAAGTGPGLAALRAHAGPAEVHPDRPAAGAPRADEPFLVFRYGTATTAAAYAPGHREPRPVRWGEPDALRGPARPPRRVEVTCPAEVLRAVTLVDAPGGGLREPAYAEILLDAARGGRLLFVTDAAVALTLEQLDFLAEADQRGVPVTFVLTKIDQYPQWPAVLAANQTLVHEHAPSLAAARWFALNVHPGNVDSPATAAAAPAVDEAARGLAGLGVADLRRALTADEPAEPVAAVPAPARPRAVVAATTDDRWREVLEREVRARHVATAQRVSIDLATVHVRCVRELGSGGGCPALPYVFDRELHAVSLRATRLLDAAVTALIRRVFGAILDAEPGPATLARIRAGVRRAAEQGRPADRGRDRILLLTATSGVAVATGPGLVNGLAAVPDPADDAVVPPLAVGLTSGCYLLWRHKTNSDRKSCRTWLQQALKVIERELDRELAGRFAELRDAVATVATDTVDHGVLLV